MYALRKWDGYFGDKYSLVVMSWPQLNPALLSLQWPSYTKWWSISLSASALVYSDYGATWTCMDHWNSAVSRGDQAQIFKAKLFSLFKAKKFTVFKMLIPSYWQIVYFHDKVKICKFNNFCNGSKKWALCKTSSTVTKMSQMKLWCNAFEK